MKQMIETKGNYTPPAIREVDILAQNMLATSSQVETLGTRKDDMDWANRRRYNAEWSDPWE